MTAPTLVQFEEALLARLATRKRPAGPFRMVKSHQGDLGRIARAGTVDGPAVFVHLDESEEAPHTSSSFARTLHFQIYLAVMNVRGEEAARLGAGSAEPGVYGLLEQVRGLLAGQDLDLEMQPIFPKGFASIIAPEQALEGPLAIYRYDFETRWIYARPETPEEAAAAVHTTSHIDFDSDGDGTPEIEGEVTHP